jgi:Sulfite exporter TauE/SafE
MPEKLESEPRSKPLAFGAGAIIGTLGGLIGLGGAEFRLPVLISLFRFRGLEAVVLNKATSLVVVATALPFRASTVPFSAVGANWPIIVNLLAGSLAGAWIGAGWATRLRSETLYRVIAVLLVFDRIYLAIRARCRGGITAVCRRRTTGGRDHRGLRDWRYRFAAWRGRRRVSNPHPGSIVRGRHQAGGEFVARGQPADHVGRLHPLQHG